MKYTVTSSEASKLLKKIMEEKAICQNKESQSCTFNASLGEEVESVRPDYDYDATQMALNEYDRKIRVIKHAISVFNTMQVVGNTGMTIDQVLVYIPQLTERKNRLFIMQDCLPKERASALGYGNNAVIDYKYANYSIEQAKQDFLQVSNELREIQAALDLVNTTVYFDIVLE